jgi:hypothetical protein
MAENGPCKDNCKKLFNFILCSPIQLDAPERISGAHAPEAGEIANVSLLSEFGISTGDRGWQRNDFFADHRKRPAMAGLCRPIDNIAAVLWAFAAKH